MSFRAVDQVLEHSRARATARCVLIAIAECAHHDGVTWLTVGEGDGDERKTICSRANCSKRDALRAIKQLRDGLRELETRKVRRGRSFITVYRVVVGSIGEAAPEYHRLPFEVEEPFLHGDDLARWKAGLAAVPDAAESSDGPLVDGAGLSPSTGEVDGDTGAGSRCHQEAVQGDIAATFTVTPTRAREKNEPVLLDPSAAEPSEETPAGEEMESAAAESSEPARRAEISEVVAGLRGADSGSFRQVEPLASMLPREVFFEVVDTLSERAASGRMTNPVGYLVQLLKIAAAEQQARAMLAFRDAVAGPGRRRQVVPFAVEWVKRDVPERYVHAMASLLDDRELAEALHAHEERMPELLALAARVRAGHEPELERETPEQAYRRFVEARAVDPEWPLDELHATIDDWRDLDDVARQELHELADTAGDISGIELHVHEPGEPGDQAAAA